MANNHVKLHAVSFGIAFGLIWGLGWMLLGWSGWLFGYALPLIRVIGSGYYGYAPTLLGGILGGFWGFIDAFIFAWLVALVYNCCCFSCKKRSSAVSSD